MEREDEKMRRRENEKRRGESKERRVIMFKVSGLMFDVF